MSNNYNALRITYQSAEALAQALHAELHQLRQLRQAAAGTVAAFETLGRANTTPALLAARTRCQTAMIGLKNALATGELPKDPRSLLPAERECCGTFPGSPHRATCPQG